MEFFQRETDRVWTRDYCPLFVKNGRGEIALTAWRFNAWAKYDDWQQGRRDPGVPRRSACKLPVFTPEMVLEGGSIDVNGAGTAADHGGVPAQSDTGAQSGSRPRGDRAARLAIIWAPGA